MDKQALLEEVRDLAEQAGRVIADIYQSEAAWVQHKADGSPLTAADMAAQSVIAEGLARLTPTIPIISEESPLPSWPQRRDWQRHWLVDPLDGTKEFVARTGEFTVNIALIEQGVPTLGVVVAPMLALSYGATAGKAWRFDEQGAAPLKVRARAQPCVVVTSRRHRGGADAEFEQRLAARVGAVSHLELGSSLKICRIAEGGADIYPRLGPTCEWDTAAADAVLRAAGGCLLAADMQPLRYHKETLLNPDFMAIGRREDWMFLADCWKVE